MKITPEEVTRVAGLARVRLTRAEKASIVRQLNEILSYVGQLDSVDTTGIEPGYGPAPAGNVLREDEVVPSLTKRDCLEGAPEKRGDFFVVPRILSY